MDNGSKSLNGKHEVILEQEVSQPEYRELPNPKKHMSAAQALCLRKGDRVLFTVNPNAPMRSIQSFKDRGFVEDKAYTVRSISYEIRGQGIFEVNSHMVALDHVDNVIFYLNESNGSPISYQWLRLP